MKILYLGTFGKHCSDPFRLKGFEKENIDFVSVDFRKVFKNGGEINLRNHIIHYLYSYNPDVVFVNKGEKIGSVILDFIRSFDDSLWMLFYGDVRNIVQPYLEDSMKFYDIILLNSDDEKYKKMFFKAGAKKIEYHHSATDTEIFKKDYQIKETSDMAFFGGNYNDSFPDSKFRKSAILRLNKKYNISIYGGGWGGLSHKSVFGKQFAYEASKAKILIGVNSFSRVNKYCSNRLWNSMACGFHLTYYFSGIEEMFKNHKHLVWFKTLEEMDQLVEYYLKNDSKRKEIYENGRRLLDKSHTYTARAKEIKNIYEGWKEKSEAQSI